MMKNLTIALSLFILMSANKCKNDTDGGTKSMDAMSSIADTKWVLQSLGGNALDLPEGTEQPWLKLAGENFEGFGGCNSLMGGVALAGDALSFKSIGSTKKYCADVQPTEDSTKSMLRKVDSFKMEDGLLKLIGGGTELAALKGM